MTDGQFWYGVVVGFSVAGAFLAISLWIIERSIRYAGDALATVASILREKLP